MVKDEGQEKESLNGEQSDGSEREAEKKAPSTRKSMTMLRKIILKLILIQRDLLLSVTS